MPWLPLLRPGDWLLALIALVACMLSFPLAWQSGVKTIYYVRSKALDPEDCESCSA